MKNNRNRQVILKSRPVDIPQANNFEIIESDVPELRDGGILVHNVYLSVEPAMRGWVSNVANYSEPVRIGEVMRSFAAGEAGTPGTDSRRLLQSLHVDSRNETRAPQSGRRLGGDARRRRQRGRRGVLRALAFHGAREGGLHAG